MGKFCKALGLVDIVAKLHPELVQDSTYLWGPNRIDFILASGGIEDAAVKAGHHPFHQHVITDHKGVYAHFVANALFDTDQIDKCHMSQRRLKLTHRSSVENYLSHLERLYTHHKILERLQLIQAKLNRT